MTNETIRDDNKFYIDKIDKSIILTRTILCGISFICCFFLMIIYFILILQVKFNLCLKKKKDTQETQATQETQETKETKDNRDSDNASENNKIQKKENKIGLGSNFMFLLTISNFFGSLFEFIFYFLYSDVISPYGDKIQINQSNIYHDMNNRNTCIFLGFAHNFFDLFAVCWTTMLTLLFYRSTNLSNEMLYQDQKYLIIGFIYSILLCLIFCGLPITTNSYGFSRYYCSFKYDDFDSHGHHLKEEASSIIWRYSFAIVTFANNLANVIWLFKTNKYYSKKLEFIKNKNKKEYKMMRKFVWIFRIFPIVLIISRLLKGMSRMIIELFDTSQTFESIIEYFNGFFFASAGIFDSIACTFFFSGVFWCCGGNSRDDSISSSIAKENDDMNLIGDK